MKKTSKMLGAIALSAAMALGTAAPAFAATVPTTTGEIQDTDDFTSENVTDGTANANTTVNVYYNADQIQAEIPIEITIVATGSKGTAGSIIAPTNYKITNKSTTKKLYVTAVKAANGGAGDWMLGSTTSDGLDTTGATFGNLDITLNGGSDIALRSYTAKTAVPNWEIGTSSALDLTLSGTSILADSASITNGNQYSADGAFTITYTVSVNQATVTG